MKIHEKYLNEAKAKIKNEKQLIELFNGIPEAVFDEVSDGERIDGWIYDELQEIIDDEELFNHLGRSLLPEAIDIWKKAMKKAAKKSLATLIKEVE